MEECDAELLDLVKKQAGIPKLLKEAKCSVQKNGFVPIWPDSLLRKVIRPTAKRAGIVGKIAGWRVPPFAANEDSPVH